MSEPLPCDDCHGTRVGQTRNFWRNGYIVDSETDACKRCDGDGVEPCWHCDEPAAAKVGSLSVCVDCAKAYDNENRP